MGTQASSADGIVAEDPKMAYTQKVSSVFPVFRIWVLGFCWFFARSVESSLCGSLPSFFGGVLGTLGFDWASHV